MSITTKGIKYGYGVQAAFGTAVEVSSGLRVNKSGGLPDFLPNAALVEAKQYDGRWGDSDYSELAGLERPGATLPLQASPGLLDVLFEQVMSSAADTDITYTLKTGTVCIPTADAYLTLVRCNELASSKDKRLTDAVVKSIKLSSSETSQMVACEVEFLASVLDITEDESGGTYTRPTEAFLMHKGLTFKIGAAATKCSEWDITFDFGTHGYIDNGAAIQEYLLGDLAITGTFKAPWADEDMLADFRLSVANVLTWQWGTPGSSGYGLITIPAKYDAPTEDENEKRLDNTVPFKLAQTSGQAVEIETNAA